MSTPTTAADPRADIQAANRGFMEAFRRRDAAAIAELYTRDGQLLPANSDVVTGTDPIRAFWQGAMDMGIEEVVLETAELEGHGDVAYEVGRYTLRAGGEAADHGKYLVIWRREGGSWKLHRDIWTTSRPAS